MTPKNRIEELAAVLNSSLREITGPQARALFWQLVPLLAQGQPVSPERIGEVLGRSQEEVKAALLQLPSIELDGAGNVVGAGLTLRPTPHRFKLKDRTLFAWCAMDALMFPGLIGQTVLVESICASTGTSVQVTVTPEGVEQVEPADAVVSLVTPEASSDVRRAFCDHVNFFRSAEAAADWLTGHPGAMILPVAEAYQVGRLLVE